MSAVRVERDGSLLAHCDGSARTPKRVRCGADRGADRRVRRYRPDVRAVLLTGDGPSFSAGADVEWMRSSVDLSFEENVADALRLRAMLDAIDGCAAPVVALVQGHALGGGCGLVACCDVVVAEPEAQFAFSEVKLGIVPAVISPFALAKIGPAAARRYFVTGERFSAEVALRIGLVHEVAADLEAAAERVLGELRSAGPGGSASGQGARPCPTLGGGDRAAHRRSPHERRGPGGPAGIPREAPARLGGRVAPAPRSARTGRNGRATAGSDPGRVCSGRVERSPTPERAAARIRARALQARTRPRDTAWGQTPAMARRNE